ncbi:hypothetical protein F5146DRAFT_1144471 [Armillaria mellea]|nr:hypothetical protein F5146DRAFT_1144471 [Armillaria mellea]
MPLLGIFSKKHKAARRGDVTRGSPSINSVNSELESALSSPTSEYIHTDRSLPSSPNGRDHLHPRDAARNVYPSAGASSSKLRLPFGRKKIAAASSSTVDNLTDYAARPGYLNSGAMSDAEADPRRHLELPPLNKRSVFGDPHSALSTRSLPDTPHSSSSPKRPFFNWSSKSHNSTPAKSMLQKARPAASSPLSPQLDDDAGEASFNLKAFRHVRPPSPAGSAASLQPPSVPAARPRNVSTASDSSQRISVAAFREAQARRSAAGSPVPSFRSISPGPQLDQGRGRPNVPPSPRQQPPHARIASRSVSRNPLDGRRLSSLVYDSDSDESASSSDADSEDDHAAKSHLGRRRTLTQQQKVAAAHRGGKSRATKSEIGHGSASASQVHTRPPRLPPPPRISTMPVSSPDVRKRASLSTSAASPSAPAQRASLIANSSPGPDSSRQSRHIREASSVSNPPATVRRSIVVSQDSDSSDSEDDAPLASLIPPRRPGSSLSHQSNRSQSSTRATKPLIDISTLTGPHRRPLESGPNASAPSPAFTPGKTLVSSPVSMTPPTPPITSTSPPTRFVSPPGSPVKAARTLSTEPSPVVPPQRTIPVRKATADSAATSSAASSSSATSSSVVTRSTASSSRVQTTPMLRADPPTPSANLQSTVRQSGHRRSSSDNPSTADEVHG